MNLRTLVSACAMIASLALPSLAGAQVRFHAGVSVGGPRPVYAPQPPPVVYVQPAAPVRMRRRHPVVIVAPPGIVIDRRHGRRHHGHR